MIKEYHFYLLKTNQIVINLEKDMTNQLGFVMTVLCEEDDALLIQRTMQAAVNTKINLDNKKDSGRYSVIN